MLEMRPDKTITMYYSSTHKYTYIYKHRLRIFLKKKKERKKKVPYHWSQEPFPMAEVHSWTENLYIV